MAIFYLDLGRAYKMAGNMKNADAAFGRAASLATDEALKKEATQARQALRK